MLLSDFKPRPALVAPSSAVISPRFPVIDAHNHLIFWGERPPAELVDLLDALNIRRMVDLDGGWGEDMLYRHIQQYEHSAPGRFVFFGGVDWSRWAEMGAGFADWAAARLRDQAAHGARGLKIWKQFGLQVSDPSGKRAAVDDARLDPIWETAGELGWPVLIHVADPVAFFDPLDATNERWEELQANPDWHFPSPPYPPFLTILGELANLVARHPRTNFIGAHVGCYAENLAWVGALMQRCPNFHADISARLGELGRQPYSARRFFLQHPDQILFGLDGMPNAAEYRLYFRFLETEDEYFPYSPHNPPPQGRWNIYGIHLPEDVLAKVYYQNAERLLGVEK